jgi:protein-S-isoprenylcysteine O-methyltransferase Ste14
LTPQRVKGRAPAGRVWELLAGHALPAAVFTLLLVNQGRHARDAIAGATEHGASLAGDLRAANAVLTVLYFALLAGLYVFRLPPRGGDRRPWIVAASFTATFMVMCVPFLPAAGQRDWLLLPADVSFLLGIVCSVWSLVYLRRSFAILPQARRLVTGGPYALSRNPLYVGEVVASWSVYLPTLSWPGALLLTANALLLLLRVHAEERVLAAAHGAEYLAYCRRVPRFLPTPSRLLRERRVAAFD